MVPRMVDESKRKTTCFIPEPPALSEAVAVTETLPLTFAPLAGVAI
jgi:hypothetical protein